MCIRDRFKDHLAYTISKYGMSFCVLGLAAELSKDKIAVNALWPQTSIDTAAVRNLLGGDQLAKKSRTPRIVSAAALEIVTTPSDSLTGQFLIDEAFLKSRGKTDFDSYSIEPGAELQSDFFL